jgi:hypothetical protein
LADIVRGPTELPPPLDRDKSKTSASTYTVEKQGRLPTSPPQLLDFDGGCRPESGAGRRFGRVTLANAETA